MLGEIKLGVQCVGPIEEPAGKGLDGTCHPRPGPGTRQSTKRPIDKLGRRFWVAHSYDRKPIKAPGYPSSLRVQGCQSSCLLALLQLSGTTRLTYRDPYVQSTSNWMGLNIAWAII